MKTLTSLEVAEISGGNTATENYLPAAPYYLPKVIYGSGSLGGRDYMSVFTRAAR